LREILICKIRVLYLCSYFDSNLVWSSFPLWITTVILRWTLFVSWWSSCVFPSDVRVVPLGVGDVGDRWLCDVPISISILVIIINGLSVVIFLMLVV
jgi:hypothetical protein